MFHNNLPIFLFTFLSLPLMEVEAQEKVDTVGVITNPTNITITSENGRKRVYADYKGEDGRDSFFYYATSERSIKETAECEEESLIYSFPYYRSVQWSECNLASESRKVKRVVLVADNIYLGWRFNYGKKGEIKNSFQFGVRNLIGIGWQYAGKGPIFSIGAGLGFSRYGSKDTYIYSKSSDKLLLIPTEEQKKKSNLDVWTLHVPLTLRQPIGKYCSASIGTAFNLNFHAQAFSSTKRGEILTTSTIKGLQQRSVSFDLFASFNVFGAGVYFCWNPVSLFQSFYGPDVKGYSIGINLLSL